MWVAASPLARGVYFWNHSLSLTLHVKCLASNYPSAFLSSFYMPSRHGSNNYVAFINLLDSTAATWSDLLFIQLV